MSEEPLNPDLAALAAALAALAPKPSGVDRDRLMFLAGQAAARTRRRPGWLWPCATAASALLAAALGAVVALRGPQSGERIVTVPQEMRTETPQTQPAADAQVAETGQAIRADYLRLRQRVLDAGIEALGEPPIGDGPGPDPPLREPVNRDLLRTLLNG